jgi:hypothetical protein
MIYFNILIIGKRDKYIIIFHRENQRVVCFIKCTLKEGTPLKRVLIELRILDNSKLSLGR